MAEEDKRESDDLADRFPRMPSAPDLPEPPKLTPTLPPPAHKQPGAVEPGSYNKMGLGLTAGYSFVGPVIVLTLIGVFLESRFGHNRGWYAICGVLLGLVVGITSLVHVVKKMSDDK